LLLVVGDLRVEFIADPIVARQYQWVPLPIRVTLPGAPETALTLEVSGNYVEGPPQPLLVPQGASATATLQLRASSNAPLGRRPVALIVRGHSHAPIFVPFEVVVEPPVITPPQLDPTLAVERIHQHYLNSGGSAGPLGYPTSAVEVSGTTAIRHYRGGEVRANLDADAPLGVVTQAFKTRTSSVRFLGFKCIRESDWDQSSATDEPYFVLSVNTTTNGIPKTVKFGPFENTETGTEALVGDLLIGDIVPNPLSVKVVAYENDAGDPDETARQLQEKLVELAQQAQSIAAASGADAADGAGIGPSAAAGAVGLLAGPVGALLAIGLVEVLGLGDDYIGQSALLAFTRPENGGTPPELGRFQGQAYNGRVEIDGRGEGHYELFFDVHVVEVEPVTVPFSG
jgi:hypothetical protein